MQLTCGHCFRVCSSNNRRLFNKGTQFHQACALGLLVNECQGDMNSWYDTIKEFHPPEDAMKFLLVQIADIPQPAEPIDAVVRRVAPPAGSVCGRLLGGVLGDFTLPDGFTGTSYVAVVNLENTEIHARCRSVLSSTGTVLRSPALVFPLPSQADLGQYINIDASW